MNPGATSERVLEALRRQILDAAWRPGDRLDPGAIAGELASSITPVRDALNRLTGEGLVESRQGGGFHLPMLDEPLLHDLYDWSEQLLRICVTSWRSQGDASGVPAPSTVTAAIVGTEVIGSFFAALARRSGNTQHAGAIDRLNARMHVVRTCERAVLETEEDEFAAWTRSIEAFDRRALLQAIARYHRRRHRVAGAVVRLVYRGG